MAFIRRKNILLLIVISVLLFLVIPTAGNAAVQEKIVEKVEVTNIEVPVRVFFKGKPVTGLKKDDFSLFVNGKKREIGTFYQVRKSIEAPLPSPRLFLLIFNISDYRLELGSALDTLFDTIIRPHDRLVMISNHFFFDDHYVADPVLEKLRVKKALEFEAGKAAGKIKVLEQQLKSLLRSYKRQLRTAVLNNNLKQLLDRDFIYSYEELVREFKNIYLKLDISLYVRLARYLKELNLEKWVFSFYQVGSIYRPKVGSSFYNTLLAGGLIGHSMKYETLRSALEVEGTLPDRDLGKLFTDSGAAFHTLLMRHEGSVDNELAADFSYAPIISDTYNLLKSIAKLTRGTFLHDQETDRFLREVAGAENIYYMLTYDAGEPIKGKRDKIKVTVRNKAYKVLYDNRKLSRYTRKILQKNRIDIRQITIEHVEFKDNTLSFIAANFDIPRASRKKKTDPVKIPVRLQVLNKSGGTLYDGVNMFALDDASKRVIRIKIDFPKIPAGRYDLLIWVGDPLTGKNDLAVKEISISQTGERTSRFVERSL